MSNLRSTFSPIGAGSHSAYIREKDDYYATFPTAIDTLLTHVEIPKDIKIWECACGEGHLSKRLIEKGYEVYSTDIINRNFGEVANFFDCTEKLESGIWILTNPPYKYAMEFVLHALELLQEGDCCIMFLKLLFLEGQERYHKLFRPYPPKAVYVFSKRISCAKNGEFFRKEYQSSAVAYCWYVWQKGFKGKPVIEWI
ncbi:class I SAM-dependent methyltransferase [Viscerimonas tarda]